MYEKLMFIWIKIWSLLCKKIGRLLGIYILSLLLINIWCLLRSKFCVHYGYNFVFIILCLLWHNYEKFLNKFIHQFQNRLTFAVGYMSLFMYKSNPTQPLCFTNSGTRIVPKLNVRLE